MGSAKRSAKLQASSAQSAIAREVLGHLNYSSGKPDPAFQRNLNVLCQEVGTEDRPRKLQQLLSEALREARSSSPAFADCTQVEAVINLTLQGCLPAYRAHHADLLFHLAETDFEGSFLLGRMFEAVLMQGEPWDERGRILSGAVHQLNDFVGYRPVAVLENGRKMELYDHERFRPLPIFIEGAGVSDGPHHDLVAATLQFLQDAPQDLLHAAHFYWENMEELAVDLRAHDHMHPVNKRTNYMFGEWDPHQIDIKGRYTRFIVRKIILDGLVRWVEQEQRDVPRSERLFDAAAAFGGTMLMASSISGSGPGTHDSNVTLTSLLPGVARRRDEFYLRLMEQVGGDRRERLQREAERTQQPFGHIRQYLNMSLAGYGARQVQHREIAYLFARMGYSAASRRQARVIPSASVRFESELQCGLGTAARQLDRGDVEAAAQTLTQVEDMLERGVSCGALVDPWNILGFHGQFPLFSSREDVVPDPRIETLFTIVDELFATYGRCLSESAAQGRGDIGDLVSQKFLRRAEWWDRFGSDVIDDLPDVSGHESWESAMHVATALAEWRGAGESAGDIAFWKLHVERFQSAQAYARVVDALLKKGDAVASMALLMQWLSQIDEIGFESPRDSIFSMLIRWMRLATGQPATATTVGDLERMFAFLEANAEDFWSVPDLDFVVDGGLSDVEITEEELWEAEAAMEEEAEGDSDDVFDAAYEHVTFRDSADDGQWGDTLDDGYSIESTEFELINRSIEPRIKFLNAVAQMWQMAASFLGTPGADKATQDTGADRRQEWIRQLSEWHEGLLALMKSVWHYPIASSSGDHDANVEFDLQWQIKLYLMHQITTTDISSVHARRLLEACVADPTAGRKAPRQSEMERGIVSLYRGVLHRDVDLVLGLLPGSLTTIKRRENLLYVPLEHGGNPESVLKTQSLQTTLRFLLGTLPKLGLLSPTWHVLQSVLVMERSSRPNGPAITEFDRAFQIALRRSLETVVRSVASWRFRDASHSSLNETLVEMTKALVEPYQELWLRHSETMRLSAVDTEGPRRGVDWQAIEVFIREYGADLFHASQLTLGNVRTILHQGVSDYLDYLAVETDPLKPVKLIEDLEQGRIERSHAEWCLELIYSIVVDKFDRFLEYNTTTTQSDYGERFHCLLDFLRLEARYDRGAWNMTPLTIAHEVLAREGHAEAAYLWEQLCEEQAAEVADECLAEYHALAQAHGMRMPAILDHLNKRFIKPLAVNRMLALVERSMEDARQGEERSDVFAKLESEIDEYLQDSWGSGIDVPEWLQSLGNEVERVESDSGGGRPGATAEVELRDITLNRRELKRQFDDWRKPLKRPKGGGASTGPEPSVGKTKPPRKKPGKRPRKDSDETT